MIVISELMANAIRHGRPPVRVDLWRAGNAVRIAVSDEAPGRVEKQSPSPESIGGRGLAIVETVAQAWGVYQERPDRKTVWAEVDELAP